MHQDQFSDSGPGSQLGDRLWVTMMDSRQHFRQPVWAVTIVHQTVGAVAGAIPVAGIFFMVAALLWYPPPAPRSGAGYHPRHRVRDRPRDSGSTRRNRR